MRWGSGGGGGGVSLRRNRCVSIPADAVGVARETRAERLSSGSQQMVSNLKGLKPPPPSPRDAAGGLRTLSGAHTVIKQRWV